VRERARESEKRGEREREEGYRPLVRVASEIERERAR